MTNALDGAKIRLSRGWYMVLDGSTREEGEYQGFVFHPDGHESASLAWALDVGTTSGVEEYPIPPEVLKDLEQYAERYS